MDPRTDALWAELASGDGGSLFTSPPWIGAVCDTYGFEPTARVAVDAAGRPTGRCRLGRRVRHAGEPAPGPAVLRPGRPDRGRRGRVAARQRRPAGRRPAVHPALPRGVPRGCRSTPHRPRGGGLARHGAGPAAGRAVRLPPAEHAAQHRHRGTGAGRGRPAGRRGRDGGVPPPARGPPEAQVRAARPAAGVLRADPAGVRPGGRAAHRPRPRRRPARGRRRVRGLGGHRLLQVRRLAGGEPGAATERRPPLAAHPLGPRPWAADPRLGPVRPRSAGPGRLQAQLGQPGGPDRDPERRRPAPWASRPRSAGC